MNLPLTPPRNKTAILVIALLVMGVTHRVILLTTLWPLLTHTITAIGWQLGAMQLLPREVLQQAPWPGLLYLQMTPPLPNLIYALLTQLSDAELRMGTMLALQSAISITTSILMALMLIRMRVSH